MPRGVKTIVWTDANDAILLRALATNVDIQINKDALEKIAAIVGKILRSEISSTVLIPSDPNMPAKAVMDHIQKLRSKARKAAANETTSPANALTTVSQSGTKRKATAGDGDKVTKKAKAKNVKDEDSDDGIEPGNIIADEPATPANLGGDGTTDGANPGKAKRTSSRKNKGVHAKRSGGFTQSDEEGMDEEVKAEFKKVDVLFPEDSGDSADEYKEPK